MIKTVDTHTNPDARIVELEALLKDAQARILSAERGYESQLDSMQASFEAKLSAAIQAEREHYEEQLRQSQASFEEQLHQSQEKHDQQVRDIELAYKTQMDELKEKIQNLIEQIKRANAARFGCKSDKIKPNQLSLFNDMEAAYIGNVELFEPELTQAPQKMKHPRRRPRKLDTSNMERIVFEHVLEGDDIYCNHCGSELKEFGIEEREVIKLIPARFVVEVHRRHKYVCQDCSEQNAQGEEVKSIIKRAEMPNQPLGKSWASASLIAHVLNDKYVNAMPLNRIEQDFLSIDKNMQVSRQCMAGWVIGVYDRWFSLICERMKVKLLEGKLVHCDESPLLVLKEPDREPSKTSQMWVFASPEGTIPICLFEYHPSRGKDVIQEFFGDWRGTLMSDCLGTYFNNEGIENLACLVHIRREFIEVIKGLDENSLVNVGSLARSAVKLINNIFATDAKFDDMTPEKRFEARNKRLQPQLDAFKCWLDAHYSETLGNSKLQAAMSNAIKHWAHVENVLKDGLFPLSNNLAERLLRPYCVGRKNWMFSDTQNGACASAGIYSVVATARANGLIPYRYMEWILEVMPNTDLSQPGAIDSFVPWNPDLPAHLFAKKDEPKIEPDDPIIDIDPHALDDINFAEVFAD